MKIVRKRSSRSLRAVSKSIRAWYSAERNFSSLVPPRGLLFSSGPDIFLYLRREYRSKTFRVAQRGGGVCVREFSQYRLADSEPMHLLQRSGHHPIERSRF